MFVAFIAASVMNVIVSSSCSSSLKSSAGSAVISLWCLSLLSMSYFRDNMSGLSEFFPALCSIMYSNSLMNSNHLFCRPFKFCGSRK